LPTTGVEGTAVDSYRFIEWRRGPTRIRHSVATTTAFPAAPGEAEKHRPCGGAAVNGVAFSSRDRAEGRSLLRGYARRTACGMGDAA